MPKGIYKHKPNQLFQKGREAQREKNPNWKGGVTSDKEYIKKQKREYAQRHPDRIVKSNEKWKKNHPDYFKNRVQPSQKEHRRKIREMAVESLGGKCFKCGFSDYRALQIDHINGGGSKERKERPFKGHFETHVLESFLKGENKYQLLCANCNWIKRSENNENRK